MATYTFHDKVNYYLKDTSTGYAGWGTFTFGSTATGGPIAGYANTTWRTILGFTVKPDVGEAITKITLNIGLIKQDSDNDNVKLGGYLYNDFNTAKQVSGPPSGYIAHFEEPSAIYTSYSGRKISLEWELSEDQAITTETDLYAWFYVNPSYYCQIWTGKSGNFKNETDFPSVTFEEEEITYTVTINNGNYGTVKNGNTTISSGAKVPPGTVLTVTPTTATGYTTTVSSSTGTISNNSLTVDGNEIITFTRTGNSYYVYYNQGLATGGTLPSTQTRTYPNASILATNAMTKSSTSVNSYTVIYAKGTAIGGTLPSAQTSVNTTKYTANGWTTGSSNTNDRDYANGASYGASSTTNLTLYPNFTASTTNGGVTLGTNNMTIPDAVEATYVVTYNANGGNCSVVSETSAVTRKYIANGWTTTSGSTTRAYADGDSTGALTSNLTLYPCFTQSVVTEAVPLPTPTRDNYEFKGWATSATATSGSFGSYVPSESVILYAIWESSADVTVDEGLVYIDSGNGWETYEIYIDNGTSWDKYVPYIDNGASWELYG